MRYRRMAAGYKEKEREDRTGKVQDKDWWASTGHPHFDAQNLGRDIIHLAGQREQLQEASMLDCALVCRLLPNCLRSYLCSLLSILLRPRHMQASPCIPARTCTQASVALRSLPSRQRPRTPGIVLQARAYASVGEDRGCRMSCSILRLASRASRTAKAVVDHMQARQIQRHLPQLAIQKGCSFTCVSPRLYKRQPYTLRRMHHIAMRTARKRQEGFLNLARCATRSRIKWYMDAHVRVERVFAT